MNIRTSNRQLVAWDKGKLFSLGTITDYCKGIDLDAEDTAYRAYDIS